MKNISNSNYDKINSSKSNSRPYMGNLTSSQIGAMAKSGALGGEMVKRMIQHEELKLMEEDKLKS
jgi:hypothetical protein